MPTTTNNADRGSIDSDLCATAAFEALANQRRRFVLYYLTRKVGAVHVDDLADQIALWEGDHSRDRYERVCTSLVHGHLPKLHDADIVRYDPTRETVELSSHADKVAPYLELAAPADVQ